MRNKKYLLILYALAFFSIFSCNNSSEIRNILQMMFGMEIKFPQKGMIKLYKENGCKDNIINDNKSLVDVLVN